MQTKYEIRPCTAEFLDASIQLAIKAEAMVQEHLQNKLGTELYSAFMRNWQQKIEAQIKEQQKNQTSFVLLQNGQVVGFGACLCIGELGIISSCYTAMDLPEDTAAVQLYDYLLAELKRNGAKCARIHIDAEAGYEYSLQILEKVGIEKYLPHVQYYQMIKEPASLPETELQIVPASETHIEDCIRIAWQLWSNIHAGYVDLIGEKLHTLAFGNWKTSQAENIAGLQRMGTSFVALLNGKVVGFCGYRIEDNINGVISYNGVDPECRGRGIARYMYEHIFNEMRSRGICAIRVTTGGDAGHSPARRAYQKAGFEKYLLSKTYYKIL